MTRRGFVATTSASALAMHLGGVAPAKASTGIVAAPPRRSTTATTVVLNVNGTDRTVRIEPRVTLLDALRDYIGLTGTKKGCDQGTCGACTVLVNGRRIDSCLSLAMMHANGERITTIEGVAGPGGTLHPVQQAFIKHDGFQCGYCTPGQIMSAVALLAETHGTTIDRETVQTRMSGNICRCGCYPHIVDAVLEAAGQAAS
jgi:xanthine dehydrogenase YagT iron-sulfur-binding subunit